MNNQYIQLALEKKTNFSVKRSAICIPTTIAKKIYILPVNS
jgi:hypothetical protein